MPKKIPERMCLGCRKMKPKKELIRVVKSPSAEISLDLGGKMSGRGAYVCRDNDCFNKVIKSNALSRAFKAQVPDEVKNELKKQLENNGD